MKTAQLQILLFFLGGSLALASENSVSTPLSSTEKNSAVVEEKAPPTDAELLDDARTKIQLLSRLGKYFEAAAMAEEILDTHPGDRATLILLGDLYSAQKNAAKLKAIGEELTRLYPDQPEGPYYTAVAALLNHQPLAAYKILHTLKNSSYRDGGFPYQSDLAEASRGSGDREAAIEEYKKALESPSLTPDEYIHLRRGLDQLYSEELSSASASSDYTWLSKDTVWRQEGYFETPIDGTLRIGAGYRRDEIGIEPGVTIPGVRSVRQDGYMKIIQDYDAEWRSTWIVGGWAQQPLGGVQVLRKEDNNHIQFSLLANEPARDTIRLESLDGRQDRVGIEASYNPAPDDYLFAETNGRLVMLDDRELGKSDDFLYGYERTVLRFPTLLVFGYRGNQEYYSQTTHGTDLVSSHYAGADQQEMQDAQASLVTSYQNLQGLYFRHTWEPTSFLAWTQLCGCDYSGQARKFQQYYFSTLAYKPWKSWEISLRGGYESNASNTNDHTDAYEMVIASEYRF